MDREVLTEILLHFRSYRYAAEMGEEFLEGSPPTYSERRQYVNRWDATRYSRIVHAINSAIRDVLTDEQATIIELRYLERNPQSLASIAGVMRLDKKTVQRKHKQALHKLGIALDMINSDPEITPFEHIFYGYRGQV